VLIIIEGNSNIPVAILSTDNTISTMDFEEARLPTVQEQPNTNFTHAQNQAAKNIIRLIGEELQNATSWPPVHLQNQPSRINENVQPSKKDNLETRASCIMEFFRILFLSEDQTVQANCNAFISSGAAQDVLLILLGSLRTTGPSTLITRKTVSAVHNILGERLLELQVDSVHKELQSLRGHPKLCLKTDSVTPELFEQFSFEDFHNVLREKAPYTSRLVERMCGHLDVDVKDMSHQRKQGSRPSSLRQQSSATEGSSNWSFKAISGDEANSPIVGESAPDTAPDIMTNSDNLSVASVVRASTTTYPSKVASSSQASGAKSRSCKN